MLQGRNRLESLDWPQDSQKAQLLIVDDEPNIRSSLGRALSLLGYSVEEAGSGHEALALLEHTAPHLMVLDMNMPGLDGVEVMRRARQMHPDLLIIILTGYATLENAIAAVKLEAVDYLRKPVSTREIADIVTQTLEKHTQQLHQQHLVDVLGETLDALHQVSDLTLSESSPVSLDLNSDKFSQNFLYVYPLRLDRQKRQVTLEDNPGHPAQLTKGETAVLSSLMTYPNQALSCQELVYSAWDDIVDEDEAKSLIRPYIFRLRRKLEAILPTPRLICTVRRHGYSFVPPS